MDSRDQIAMAAMQGFLSYLGFYAVDEDVAERAYQMADAMIAEREKDDVETKDQIKQMLVDAINKAHPGMNTSTVCTAEHLIFQLTTGKPF